MATLQRIRVVVVIAVILATIKLWSSGSRLENEEKLEVREQSSFQDQTFWRAELIKSNMNNFKLNNSKMPLAALDKDSGLNDLPKIHEVKIVAPLVPLRVVHLDLKGAAPKLKYLEQLFPLFSTLGADGVLLEYEDMFPFYEDINILRSPHAYSVGDIEQIKNMAKLNKLELIPLVQVFGHFEFVLKHKQYHHLREVEEFPNSLNPRHPESVALVKKMLTQVMDAHPEARWLHMGADEVRSLGQGSKNSEDTGELFLNHVVKVARFISEKRPGLNVIMWDDMLRKIDPATIQKSGLQNVTVPAIWKYTSDIDKAWIDELIARYQAAGFKGVWFASAFKGASGIDQQWTPLTQHLQNHMAWTAVMKSMPSMVLQGILLTGWQRYEHYTVLCELLPVAIPSLAMCLQSLKNGAFDAKAKAKVQHILGCEVQVAKNLCVGGGAFPGEQIYKGVLHIQTNLKKEVDFLMAHRQLKGGFTRYHRRHNFGNPRNIGFFKDKLDKLLEKWEAFMHDFRMEMEAVYFTDTMEEWMEENVNPHLDQLRELSQDAERILKLNGQPKSL